MQNPLPHFGNDAFIGFGRASTAEQQAAVDLSNTLIEELMNSDAVVIGTPVFDILPALKDGDSR